MADPFSNWLFTKRNQALDELHRVHLPQFAESPTQSVYLDRSVGIDATTDQRIPITQVVTSNPLASFCKIINVPHQIKILQLKDLRDPRHAVHADLAMKHLFSTISCEESEHLAAHIALISDAFIVIVPDGFEGHLQLGFLLSSINHFHILFILGEKSKIWARIDVRSENNAASYVQETILGKGAQAQIIVRESATAGNLFSAKRSVAYDQSKLVSLVASKATKTLLSSSRVRIAGTDVKAQNFALFRCDGEGSLEQESIMHHDIAGGSAQTATKGICSGSSTALVRGVIRIEEHAPQTSSHYEGKVMLTSPTAKANVLPTLQIYTNDVSAKHGAAVGHFTPEEIYYLQSRGITLEEARIMLTEGFFESILSQFSSQDKEGIRQFFYR
jgi:Fe-S cluster assembly protein SufD